VKKIFEKVMPPKTGLAVEVMQGQTLRIIDLEGKQVVDMAVFNKDNPREKLSTSFSRTRYIPEPGEQYTARDHVEEGDWLMSTLCRPLMTIIKETTERKGVHDACQKSCNSFLYEVFGYEPRDGCLEIISKAVAPYGILMEDIPDTLDIFMNYPYDCKDRRFKILEPITKQGDYIEFRAEMNCIVGLSNCPEDVLSLCNAKHCTPVKVEIYEDETYQPEPILPPKEWLDRELRRRGLRK